MILVISLLVLLGMGALVLDVGSWFQAHRQTQSAADAAALAAAHALPEDATAAQTLASQYLTKNGGGTATVTVGSGVLANDTARVVLTRETPGFFAKAFGVSTVNVTAKAGARSGTPAEARWAAPFAVDEAHPMLQCRPLPCFGEETRLELDKVGPGAYRVLNIDDSHGGSGPKILEDWIMRGWEGYMPLDWYFSDPGAKFDSDSVRDALDARLGSELLFPVYRKHTGVRRQLRIPDRRLGRLRDDGLPRPGEQAVLARGVVHAGHLGGTTEHHRRWRRFRRPFDPACRIAHHLGEEGRRS